MPRKVPKPRDRIEKTKKEQKRRAKARKDQQKLGISDVIHTCPNCREKKLRMETSKRNAQKSFSCSVCGLRGHQPIFPQSALEDIDYHSQFEQHFDKLVHDSGWDVLVLNLRGKPVDSVYRTLRKGGAQGIEQEHELVFAYCRHDVIERIAQELGKEEAERTGRYAYKSEQKVKMKILADAHLYNWLQKHCQQE